MSTFKQGSSSRKALIAFQKAEFSFASVVEILIKDKGYSSIVTTHSLDPHTLPDKPPLLQNPPPPPRHFVELLQHSVPILANSDTFSANSNGPLANFNVFSTAASAPPGFPEPLGPLPRCA
ncbi:hypothetical protein H2248_002957 [Termitomyces sp. 'cryptogamus']|nr:hypothetical protein H2248_002957 [Termitomyces sp. 'cryptogamus']